jgi:hypothetical protein
LAAQQLKKAEMGDATNLVPSFIRKLLHQAERLLKLGPHPSEVIDGSGCPKTLGFYVYQLRKN